MKPYKAELLGKLNESGWKLIEQDNDTDWWIDESWKIQSEKQSWGLQVYILFLVDPQYEGNDKSQAVWAIGAANEIPHDRPTTDECILIIDLQKGHLDSKLSQFVDGINKHRNSN